MVFACLWLRWLRMCSPTIWATDIRFVCLKLPQGLYYMSANSKGSGKTVLIPVYITKTCLYNFDPLKPHFYTVKLGFTGVYVNFLISAQNIDCGYSLELPRWGSSNKYRQSMFWAEIWKSIRIFYLKIFIFLVVKFSVYLKEMFS